jgi:glucan phosphoethanolaminetransferase (alkaline phosphatase superfamily)
MFVSLIGGGSLMIKKSFGITVIGCFFVLWSMWHVKGALLIYLNSNLDGTISSLTGFIFYLLLGIGILKFNNKARIIAIVYIGSLAIAGPIGLIYSSFLLDKNLHNQTVNKYGKFIEIYPWLVILPVSILCLSCIIYLTRPSVRELFIKKDK